jgi:hypothetical protein
VTRKELVAPRFCGEGVGPGPCKKQCNSFHFTKIQNKFLSPHMVVPEDDKVNIFMFIKREKIENSGGKKM